MAPQQKGKQGTKGAKQIVDENKSTLAFYRNMSLGSAVVAGVANFGLFQFTNLTVTMYFLSLVVLAAAYKFMAFMSNPSYSESGALLEPGNDLNMEGGIAENVKDLIILTSATLLLALTTNWFWIVLLLAPARAIWMLWGSVIQPWLAQRNAEEPEVDEKKQRKMERKMRRMR